MARRNDHAPEALRSLAIEAARRIATVEGLRGVTVRRVAERIGYAPGTLYNLFENLDELVVHVNAETLRRLGEALDAAAASPPGERARRLVDAYFDFVEAEPQLWSILFEHRLPPGSELPDWYRDALEALLQRVAAALEPVMEGWPAAERRTAIAAMWASLHGISTLAVSGKLALVEGGEPRRLGHLVVGRMVAAGPSDRSSWR